LYLLRVGYPIPECPRRKEEGLRKEGVENWTTSGWSRGAGTSGLIRSSRKEKGRLANRDKRKMERKQAKRESRRLVLGSAKGRGWALLVSYGKKWEGERNYRGTKKAVFQSSEGEGSSRKRRGKPGVNFYDMG